MCDVVVRLYMLVDILVSASIVNRLNARIVAMLVNNTLVIIVT